MDSISILTDLCEKRLASLTESGLLYDGVAVYNDRLKYELSVYDKSGYSDLILIIQDYINWAKRNGIIVGPGRGSAAGSLVVYLCGITTIDPIRFGLIFERFLNPERISLPDIDTDFSDRDAVIEYIKKKYGRNRVSKVGVPSLFKPRSAIDEFARILGIEFKVTKAITKIIGDAKTFDEAKCPELDEYEKVHQELFSLSKKVQGLVRQITTHPSAVILAMGPIGAEIPMQRAPGESGKDGELVTGWDGEELDQLGYAKLDILTVDNLTVIGETVKLAGLDIDIYNIPLDDQATLDNFKSGNTTGVFQFEEPKSVGILKAIEDINFGDICAVNALIRPGLDVRSFLERRNNPAKTAYIIPELKNILGQTYGVILYQEQVMKMCVDLAGFTMAEADKVRKIIAKTANHRSDKGLNEVYEKFKKGYIAKGLDASKFEDLWSKILDCQNYIFNYSHATCYGYIAYVDMYLKTHYPLQFMCSCLKVRSREVYIKECQRLGIEVLVPDVELSDDSYSIEGNSIRMGLSCIKHIGAKSAIIRSKRTYADEYEFVSRVKLSKDQMRSLVYAGALDRFGSRVDLASTFCFEGSNKATLGDVATGEKEAIGFYFKFDPLGGFQEIMKQCITAESAKPQYANVGGQIIRVKVHEAKTGPMAFVNLMTMDGEIDALVWPSDYKVESAKLVVGNIIIAKGKKTDKDNYSINNISILKSQS